MKLELKPVTYKACKFACQNWHYSKKIPASAIFRLGIFEDDIFKGIILFGKGASINIGSPFNLKHYEICELTRIALINHTNPVSKIISIAIKILKKQNPSIKLIVSYADCGQSHLGIIYQASNWLYLGKTNIEYHYEITNLITKKKVKLHRRIIGSRKKGTSIFDFLKNKFPNCKFEYKKDVGKFKYVYILNNELNYLKEKAMSYPKNLP